MRYLFLVLITISTAAMSCGGTGNPNEPEAGVDSLPGELVEDSRSAAETSSQDIAVDTTPEDDIIVDTTQRGDAGVDTTQEDITDADVATGQDPSFVAFDGGEFTMGGQPWFEDEVPLHQVTLSPFLLHRYEVTSGDFAACVEDGACSPETFDDSNYDGYCNFGNPDRLSHPMNCVAWEGARQYCEYVEGSLPTEAQWEFAARGSERREWPWGDEPKANCDVAIMNSADDPLDDRGEEDLDEVTDGCGLDSTWPVGSRPLGQTPDGIFDMGGNVWEWANDCWYMYSEGPEVDPNHDGSNGEQPCGYRVLRGGGWTGFESVLRAALRYYTQAEFRMIDVGFRCAR